MQGRTDPSDLTDEQWALVADRIPVYPGGRPRKTSMRAVLNAIFYIVRTGCQWEYLPRDVPPKSTVWGYFDEWRHNGTLEDIHDALRTRVRQAEARDPTPSAGSTDSQSVTASAGGDDRGYDAHKKVNGRKRHSVVDTLGLLLAVTVTAANTDDARAAPAALRQVAETSFPRRRVIWADQKYHNYDLYAWVEANAAFKLAVVRRPEGAEGFVLLPKRWVVERTFAWLKRCRRLSIDRDRSVMSSEAMIRLGMIRLMLNRLAPPDGRRAYFYRSAA